MYHIGINLLGEANALNNIGGTYNAFGETRKALEPFQQALQIQRQLDDKKGLATTLNNMGTAYSHLGDGDRALALYKEALPVFETVGDQRGVETARKNIQQLDQDRRRAAGNRH
jgi:tetratricopeptide (TPR) repeat protein